MNETERVGPSYIKLNSLARYRKRGGKTFTT